MGVIKFPDRSFRHIRERSSNESLNLVTQQSDTESLASEQTTASSINQQRISAGGRRIRRHRNVIELESLIEEEEFEDVVPDHVTPLSKLFTDPLLMEIWNRFIESSEEEQLAILNSNQRHHLPRPA